MNYFDEISSTFGWENTQRVVHRSTEIIEFLVFCSTIGLFAGFWKVYMHFFERKRNINLKITYVSGQQQIEVEMKQLSQKDYEEVLKQYPPDPKQNVRLLITE